MFVFIMYKMLWKLYRGYRDEFLQYNTLMLVFELGRRLERVDLKWFERKIYKESEIVWIKYVRIHLSKIFIEIGESYDIYKRIFNYFKMCKM